MSESNTGSVNAGNLRETVNGFAEEISKDILTGIKNAIDGNYDANALLHNAREKATDAIACAMVGNAPKALALVDLACTALKASLEALETGEEAAARSKVSGQEMLGKMVAFFATSYQTTAAMAVGAANEGASRLDDAHEYIATGKTLVENLLHGSAEVGGDDGSLAENLRQRLHPDLFDHASNTLGVTNNALDDSIGHFNGAAQQAQEYADNI
jgi:hypothetical protein